MSKLEELIQELCPNGVKYIKLDNVVTFSDGFAFKSEDFTELGEHKVIKITNLNNGEIVDSNFYISEIPKKLKAKHILEGNEILVAMSGSTGNVGVNMMKGALVNQRIGVIKANNDYVISGFLKHLLVNRDFKNYCFSLGTGPQNNISRSQVLGYFIPVPPLVIQQEIVRILDTMTNLTAELTAELTARKKQYEYYRDMLLNFGDDVEFKNLGDYAILCSGGTPNTKKPEYWVNGTIPWMSSGEVNDRIVTATEKLISIEGYTNSSTKMIPINSVFIALAGQGKTRGKVAINTIELCTNQSLCAMIPNDQLNYKFLFYYLDSNYQNLREISSGDGNRGGLNLKMIASYKIPVPPLETQQKIVDILDRFDVYCNDITTGLPAEIEARQKQYEYYRNKLLTFKEL